MINQIIYIFYFLFLFSFSLIASGQINDKGPNSPVLNVKCGGLQGEEDNETLKNRIIEKDKQNSLLLSQLTVMEQEKIKVEEENENLSKHNFNNLLIISQLTNHNTFLESSLNSLQMAYDKSQIELDKFRLSNLSPPNQYTPPYYTQQPSPYRGTQQEYDENTNHPPVYKNNYQQNNKNRTQNSFTKRRPKSEQN